MKGLIVIEGGDGAGKSTLARAILEKTKGRSLHLSIHANIWKWHLVALRRAVRLADEAVVVVDRHWPSEAVYGQVFRGTLGYEVGARVLDRVLLGRGAISVMCVPTDLEGQLRRHGARHAAGGEHFPARGMERVVAAYADAWHGNLAASGFGYLGQITRFGGYRERPDAIRYDVDEVWGDPKKLDSAVRVILRRLSEQRLRSWQPALKSERYNFSGFLGSAKYLFVGEQVSPKTKPGWPKWPFSWSDGPSAATYLNRALHEIQFDEAHGVWTNAFEDDYHLTVALSKPELRVIALGKLAVKLLKLNGITPHREVPHPGYWRRFHHHDFSTYAKILQEALG